ncbi:hypothetical protein [Dyella terrae]|uniref:Uncharacterized protein n=2 Tax=Dyella TaxID=231454 RepID=A0A4R0YP17_9GAMM|nr:hypothetical protein [Dyella terrae]TCI07745.1 hypothetical protein EZM97_23985 [Dyella soli]
MQARRCPLWMQGKQPAQNDPIDIRAHADGLFRGSRENLPLIFNEAKFMKPRASSSHQARFVQQHRECQSPRRRLSGTVSNGSFQTPVASGRPLGKMTTGQAALLMLMLAGVTTAHALPAHHGSQVGRGRACPQPLYSRPLKGESGAQCTNFNLVVDDILLSHADSGAPTAAQFNQVHLGRFWQDISGVIPRGQDLRVNVFSKSQFRALSDERLDGRVSADQLSRISGKLAAETHHCLEPTTGRPIGDKWMIAEARRDMGVFGWFTGEQEGLSQIGFTPNDGATGKASVGTYQDTLAHETAHVLGTGRHAAQDAVASDGKPALMRPHTGFFDQEHSMTSDTKAQIGRHWQRGMV